MSWNKEKAFQDSDAIPIPNHTISSLFALIIGIDDYYHVRKLKGAVADANAIDSHLRQQLGVPATRIINLRNEGATRKKIIEAIRSLGKNPNIKRQDAILIYFAGHGSEAEAPASWETGSYKVQVILPQDIRQKSSKDHVVQAIPDRTIAALLDELARKKGDNITVIFDCCHSSSGTRGDANVPGRVARVADYQGKLAEDLDNNIIKGGAIDKGSDRSMNIPAGFLQANLRSHVLLAACGAEELAWEHNGGGAFTAALIETLTATGVDAVTYTGLMQRLPSLPSQNPQCEGHNRNRILFNSKVTGSHRHFFGVEQRGSTYVLESGIVQGISVGSVFAIHADNTESQSNPPLCTMRVKSTEAFSATLEPLDDRIPASLPTHMYARQVRCGPGNELRVHFSKRCLGLVSVDALRRAALDTQEPDIGFVVTTADKAELLVDVTDEETIFTITHSLAKLYAIERLPHTVPANAEEISRVLRAAARWNWHLKRTNSHPFDHAVRLEFMRLEQVEDKFDGHGMPIMKPVGENMNSTGIIEMVVDPDDYFGIKLINPTAHHLYPYLFYFDIKNQRIEPYYLCPTGKQQVDPPLLADSSLTIGYGASGAVPFAFCLHDDEKIDLGFFKVFLTTSHVELGELKQGSPFEGDRGSSPREDVMKKLMASEWDTVMTAVVQRAEQQPLDEPTVIHSKRKFRAFCERRLGLLAIIRRRIRFL